MRVAIIGYGSIGKRHATVAKGLGNPVAVLSQQQDLPLPSYTDLKDLLSGFDPEAVVVANDTAEHIPTLSQLRKYGYQGRILVEKPMAVGSLAVSGISNTRDIYTAYNLRQHQISKTIKACTESQKVYSGQLYVGQYLPTWRPQRNYRETYSAKKSLGGGVLRDLSHELDLLLWWLGDWDSVAAFAGKQSALDIDCEDTVSILVRMKSGASITLEMNYLDRIGQRRATLNLKDTTIYADWIHNTLSMNMETHPMACTMAETYKNQMVQFLEPNIDSTDLCTWEESLRTVQLIEAIEQAHQKQSWVVQS